MTIHFQCEMLRPFRIELLRSTPILFKIACLAIHTDFVGHVVAFLLPTFVLRRRRRRRHIQIRIDRNRCNNRLL